MEKHVKVYMEAFHPDYPDWLPCEMCKKTGTDFHHIWPRGMGGSKKMDTPCNIMLLCRSCHDLYGDKTKWRETLIEKHMAKCKTAKLSDCQNWHITRHIGT